MFPKVGLIFLKIWNLSRLIHLENNKKYADILPMSLLIFVLYAVPLLFCHIVLTSPLFPYIFTTPVVHTSPLCIGVPLSLCVLLLLLLFCILILTDIHSMHFVAFLLLHVKGGQLIYASHRVGWLVDAYDLSPNFCDSSISKKHQFSQRGVFEVSYSLQHAISFCSLMSFIFL